MKYSNVIVLSLAVVATLASARFQVPTVQSLFVSKDENKETPFRFVNECIRASWTGFMTGFYHSSLNKFIPTEACFGGWIEEDLSEIQTIGQQIIELDFMSMDFEEVSNAAVDVVELFFKQDEQCGFRQFLTDLGDFCEKSTTCQPDSVVSNLQKNAFQIMTKLTMMGELIQKSKSISTNLEVYDALEETGEVVGGVAASLIAFKV